MTGNLSIQPIKCPACKGLNIVIDETGTWLTSHCPDGTSNNEPGEYFRVDGRCLTCRKTWRIKGRIQFDGDLEERLEKNGEILANSQ